MKGMLNKAFSIALLISALPMVAMEQTPVAQGFMSRAGEFVSSNYKSASASLVKGYNDYVVPTVATATTKASDVTTSVVTSVKGHPYIYGGVAGVTALGLTGGLVYKYRRPAVVKPVVNPVLAHDFAIFAKMQDAMTKNQVIDTPVFNTADKITFGNGKAVDQFAKTIAEYNERIVLPSVFGAEQVQFAKENVKDVIDCTIKAMNAIEAQAQALKAAPKAVVKPVPAAKAPAIVAPAAPNADVAVVKAPAPAAAVAPTVVVKPTYSTRTKVLVAGGLLATLGVSTFALYNYFFKSPVA